MKNLIKEMENKIRQVCTYYSELGEGTAGYDLTEEQFQKLFQLIFHDYTEKIIEGIRGEVEKMRRPFIGKDQYGTEIYKSGTGDIQYNNTIDNVLSILSSLTDKEKI